MKVYIVSPTRSFWRVVPSDIDGGMGREFFLDVKNAEYVRDRWNERYPFGKRHYEVYEVEARITRKVPCPSVARP